MGSHFFHHQVQSSLIMSSSLALSAVLVVCLAGSSFQVIQEHCTDISFYDVVHYTTSTKTCCETNLNQVCTLKTESVCLDVLELKCDVVAFTDCKQEAKTHQGTTCAVDIKDYPYQECREVKTSTKHTKQVPDCKKVTKNNCVTDWEINDQGDKVWAGTETYTPVTWEECEFIEKEVEFPSIETDCKTTAQIKWFDYLDKPTDVIGMETKCEVKSAVNCEDVVVNKCSAVSWQECKMEPV